MNKEQEYILKYLDKNFTVKGGRIIPYCDKHHIVDEVIDVFSFSRS